MRLSLEEAARMLSTSLSRPAPGLEATGVAVDSRRVRPGDLFLAIKGEFLDGHDFVEDVFQSGAAAAVVSRPVPGAPGPLLLVADPLLALARLARWARDTLDPVVIGVSGSTGKTSTKDLLASITRRKFSTVAPERSYNNDIGVPLTLLAAGASTEVVVCELGARGPGQIARLCAYVRPQVGVVTNVGVTHYEQFGSVEAIASAKAELVAALPEGGTAVLNADDPMTSAMAAKTSANVVSFGTSPTAWLRAERIRLDRLGRPSFRMVRGFEGTEASLSVAGRHQVANALAASAAAMALGLSLEECRAGLEGAAVSPWRMEVREVGGVVVVNDAYNANPTSMSSALETCAQMAGENGRLVAVLGYMAELGERSTLEHEAAGALAASLADRLVVVGEAAGPIAEGARRAGLRNVVPVPDRDAALGAIGELARGDVVLVKASRIAGLDALAGALLEVLEPLEKFERPAAR